MNKTLIFYSILLCLFSIFSYFFIDPNLIYLHSLYSGVYLLQRPIVTLTFTLFLIFLYLFYFRILSYVETKRITIDQLKKIIIAVSCILFFSYPAMLSYDIF